MHNAANELLVARTNGSEYAWTTANPRRRLDCVMRILAYCLLAFAGPLLTAAPTTTAAPDVPVPDLRIMRGDDSRWASPGWDDRNWPIVNSRQLPGRTGIYWVRRRVVRSEQGTWQDALPNESSGAAIDAIVGSSGCSFDFYWDGRLLLRNGVVGWNRESEVAGTVDFIAQIPGELLGSGVHVEAFRISSFHYNFPGQTNFRINHWLANYDNVITRADRDAIFPMIGMGCALVSAVICGVLFWLVDRRKPLLLCSLFSTAVAAYYLLASWRSLSWLLFKPETYDQVYPISLGVDVVMALVGCLLLVIFLEQFAIAGKRGWLAAQGVLVAAVWCSTWDRYIGTISGRYMNVVWDCQAALAVSAGAASWAAWRRRPGARFAAAVALFGLATVRLDPGEAHNLLSHSFLATFALLVLAVLSAIGLQVQAARRAARAAELTAARMEIELLKKNLQPHFLLNTLTALTEVVEQSPREAVRLIEDLAEELRSLSRMSAEKLIPLSQELDLCRAHLRVMSLRTSKTWRLEAENLDLAALVPPALFLTLIENGFTHQRVATPSAAFVLRQERAPNGAKSYIFESPGSPPDVPARAPGGTGLRYVKARLEESFPGRWSFRQGPIAGGWQSIIEIFQIA